MSVHQCLSEFDPTCPDCVRHDEECGTRCEACGERMCEQFGPVPRICSSVCADCACDCLSCRDHQAAMKAELLRKIEKEGR